MNQLEILEEAYKSRRSHFNETVSRELDIMGYGSLCAEPDLCCVML
jgi:hypothetical protein